VDLEDLVETVQASGTPAALRVSGTGPGLSPALELTIYRVIQEALTNVVKHAPGAAATVEIDISDECVHIEVVDQGRPGLAEPGGHRASGQGIVGMRERISAFGGRLQAAPDPGGGFRVVAEVPIEGHP
jgi:signal transduction histidine kinase